LVTDSCNSLSIGDRLTASGGIGGDRAARWDAAGRLVADVCSGAASAPAPGPCLGHRQPDA